MSTYVDGWTLLNKMFKLRMLMQMSILKFLFFGCGCECLMTASTWMQMSFFFLRRNYTYVEAHLNILTFHVKNQGTIKGVCNYGTTEK